jgi:hypothetical protein
MNDQSLEALTRRLDRVERHGRGWRVIGSAALGLVGVVVLIGATAPTVPGEIRTQRVVIVDEAGRPRIVLGKKEGAANVYEVSLANAKGVPTAVLYVEYWGAEEGAGHERAISGLEFRDSEGKIHANLRTRALPDEDEAGLWLRGEIQEIPGNPVITSPETLELHVASHREKAYPGERSYASVALRTDRVGTSVGVYGKEASALSHF